MPLATFRHPATAAATPDEVWAALQSAETWGGIGLIDSVWDQVSDEDEEGRLRSFQFRTEAGGRTWDGTARVIASVPGERMDLSLSTKEIRGRVGVALEADGARTTINVRLEAEPAGMLATLFWSVVSEAISSTYARQIEDFAASFSG